MTLRGLGSESRRLLGAALLLLAGSAHALSSNAGTSGAQFLKLGSGARAGAMGEAHLALASDVHAAFYNPAGLTRLTRPSAAGMHSDRFQEVDYDALAFAYPFQVEGAYARHVLAAAVYNLSVDDLERRTQDTDLAIGTFNASDSAYAVSYARRWSDRLAVGGTFKLVRTTLDVVRANAAAADLGAQYRLGTARPLDLGVVVRNLGTSLGFEQGDDPLPLAFGAGAAVEWSPGLVFAADALKSNDTGLQLSAGAEWRVPLGERLAGSLRGGYSTRFTDPDGLAGMTAGLGLELGSVGFDFAWIPFGDLGHELRYSLQVRF